MGLLDDLVAVKERESGGSTAIERFDFQTSWGVSRILKLHDGASEYALAFEFHDDVIVIDDLANPQAATFFQLKTDASKNWTLARIGRPKTEKGKKKPSFSAKMYDNKVKFGDWVKALVFVSNMPANFPAGPFSTAPDLEYKEFLKKMKEQIPSFPDEHGKLFEFEKSHLDLTSYEHTVIGEVVDFVGKHGSLETCNHKAFYLTVANHCKNRSRTVADVSSVDDLLASKFVTRSVVSKWLADLVAAYKERPAWAEIVPSLAGIPIMQQRAIREQWFIYERAKLSGMALPTLAVGKEARIFLAAQSGSTDPLLVLLDKGTAALKKKHSVQQAMVSDSLIAAVILYEMLSS